MDSFKAADLPDDEELVSSRCEQSTKLRANRGWLHPEIAWPVRLFRCLF